MVLISKYLLPKEFIGLTLWPIIILKNEDLKENEVLLNHERIHLKQQLELGIIPFYIWYLIEWIIGLLVYRGNTYKAYRNISFEQEAYDREADFDFMQNRKPFNFLKYLRKK